MHLLHKTALLLSTLAFAALAACGGDDGPSIGEMSKFLCDCEAKEEDQPPTADELAQCRAYLDDYLAMAPTACHDCLADKVEAKSCSIDSCEAICPDDD
jgi:hypothetical protein